MLRDQEIYSISNPKGIFRKQKVKRKLSMFVYRKQRIIFVIIEENFYSEDTHLILTSLNKTKRKYRFK